MNGEHSQDHSNSANSNCNNCSSRTSGLSNDRLTTTRSNNNTNKNDNRNSNAGKNCSCTSNLDHQALATPLDSVNGVNNGTAARAETETSAMQRSGSGGDLAAVGGVDDSFEIELADVPSATDRSHENGHHVELDEMYAVSVAQVEEQEENKADEQDDESNRSSGLSSPASFSDISSPDVAGPSGGNEHSHVTDAVGNRLLDAATAHAAASASSAASAGGSGNAETEKFDFLDMDIDPRDESRSSSPVEPTSGSINESGAAPALQLDESLLLDAVARSSPSVIAATTSTTNATSTPLDSTQPHGGGDDTASSSATPPLATGGGETGDNGAAGDSSGLWLSEQRLNLFAVVRSSGEQLPDVDDVPCTSSSFVCNWRGPCAVGCQSCDRTTNQTDAEATAGSSDSQNQLENALETLEFSPPRRRHGYGFCPMPLHLGSYDGEKILREILKLTKNENEERASHSRVLDDDDTKTMRGHGALVSLLSTRNVHRLSGQCSEYRRPSACGAMAVELVLNILNDVDAERVDKNVRINTRAYEAPIGEYLLSRSKAGAIHSELQRAVRKTTNDRIRSIFYPTANKQITTDQLASFLRSALSLGCVPVLTMNLQRRATKHFFGRVSIPDAWHHQVCFQVDHHNNVSLLNPTETLSIAELLPLLDCDSVLLVSADNVLEAWQRANDLRQTILKRACEDVRWTQMNVIGQVLNVVRQRDSVCHCEVPASHVIIPAAYTPGITLYFDANKHADVSRHVHVPWQHDES